MKLYLSPKAHYQYQCLKGRNVRYAEQVKALMLEEFDLPPERTTFEYAIHWDIGHCWR